jgi:D-Tyr-tRNAtyr deacylase
MTESQVCTAAAFAVTVALQVCGQQPDFHTMSTADQKAAVVRVSRNTATTFVKKDGRSDWEAAEVAEVAENLANGLSVNEVNARAAVRTMAGRMRAEGVTV